MVDAGDVYTAGKNFELIPILVEQYNLETPEYYAVAVAWEEDPDTDILYLKGELMLSKRICIPNEQH